MITLLHGDEGYLVDQAAGELLARLRGGLSLEFNYEDLQAETLTPEQFADRAATLPFIDAERVLVLRDWGALSGKREKGGAAERAATLLASLPESTHLVLILHAVAAPQNPVFRAVAGLERERKATIRRFDPPRRADRAGWVRRLAEARQLTITPGAVRLLLQRAEPDLRLIDQEIAKLELYVSPERRVDESSVAALVSESREEDIFALTDALGSERPTAVASVLKTLLDAGREPTYLLYLLVGHWRRLIQARAARDRGEDLGTLQRRLADHPFVVERAYQQAARFDAAELERGFRELYRLEEMIKLGELDARLALEGFVLELALR
jgi:DNA polymerase-3 subunit delta